jgi:hypothetical protein
MKYACGHESHSGVGNICIACHKAGITLPKPKKKMGRPVGPAPFNKRQYDAQYYRNNKTRLNAYNAAHKRKARASIVPAQ